MDAQPTLQIIAHIRTEFPTKFGVPRQSGLAQSLRGKIIFTPPYRNADALRGLEGFSHIWLLWQFSGALREGWQPTVRPPRLGGNRRMGVFATRSPFRPNAIGLSAVQLLDICSASPEGPVLTVAGADLADGTPIYDIKPYLPYVDSIPQAQEGFTQQTKAYALQVQIPPQLLQKVPPQHRDALLEVLRQDPRPAYQNSEQRVYGFGFAGLEIGFTVSGNTLTVCRAEPAKTE